MLKLLSVYFRFIMIGIIWLGMLCAPNIKVVFEDGLVVKYKGWLGK